MVKRVKRVVALIKMITSDFSRSFHPRFVQKIELVFPPLVDKNLSYLLIIRLGKS